MDNLYFLDFDGVICDSIYECFVSSWIAYYKHLTKIIPSETYLKEIELFKEFRPYIRRGADYLLIHKIINQGKTIKNQNDFNILEKKEGDKTMDNFHDLFYLVRNELINSDKDYWLGLNLIYPKLKKYLLSISTLKTFYILSTKKAEFIHEILLSNNINWDINRIIYSGKDKKVDIINNIMLKLKISNSYFIDDQIDHFLNNPYDNIKCFLASWGYVKDSWLAQNKIPIVDEDLWVKISAVNVK